MQNDMYTFILFKDLLQYVLGIYNDKDGSTELARGIWQGASLDKVPRDK